MLISNNKIKVSYTFNQKLMLSNIILHLIFQFSLFNIQLLALLFFRIIPFQLQVIYYITFFFLFL